MPGMVTGVSLVIHLRGDKAPRRRVVEALLSPTNSVRQTSGASGEQGGKNKKSKTTLAELRGKGVKEEKKKGEGGRVILVTKTHRDTQSVNCSPVSSTESAVFVGAE